MTTKMALNKLTPVNIMEMSSVERYQHFLDTGNYPDGLYSKTWDMLAWINNEKNKNSSN